MQRKGTKRKMETTKVEAVTELFSKTTKVEAGAALLGTTWASS